LGWGNAASLKGRPLLSNHAPVMEGTGPPVKLSPTALGGSATVIEIDLSGSTGIPMPGR
jgi:hypothetical protein